MATITNTFWIVISAILFAAFACGVIILIVLASLMAQQDKDTLQFKGMTHAELTATTRVLLARDAKHPKRARYKGRFDVY